MKRILLYIVIIGAVMVAPVHKTDVGKLQPVQVISLYQKENKCIIETDTDDMGVGENSIMALKNLKETTPGIIYLDTAEYVLVGEGTDRELERLRNTLKANVKLCRSKEKIEPKQAAEYLRVHNNLPKLKVWEINEKLPILEHFGDKIILLEKYEKKG